MCSLNITPRYNLLQIRKSTLIKRELLQVALLFEVRQFAHLS